MTLFLFDQERQWLDHLETFCMEDVAVLGIFWHFLLTLLVWVPLGLMVITVSYEYFAFHCATLRIKNLKFLEATSLSRKSKYF